VAYCPNCGANAGDARFCPNCGQGLAATGNPVVSAVPTTPPPPAGYAPRSPTTSGKAIASLVLGILWVGGLGSLLALILGYSARGDIKRSNGWVSGNGMAVAGIVLGWIGAALVALVIIGIASAPRYYYP
jgi:hypothetical protein